MSGIPNGYLIARREPIGVVGQIIPWNVPAIMVALCRASRRAIRWPLA
ncbi:aldehyde dehydrogenase family protein [Paraburkholderia fungorum]